MNTTKTSSASPQQQQFVLQWHYHDTTLLNSLPCFLDNELLTDVVLSVGLNQFKAHKLVLAMCSSYFFQLFQEVNAQQPVVVLHNVTSEDIRAILSFIYKGQCVVTKDHLPSLLSVAKLLKIQGLCDMKVPEEVASSKDTLSEITKICDNLLIDPEPKKVLDEVHVQLEDKATKKTSSKKPQSSSKDSSETCKCFLCGKYLSNQYNLRVHMETHEEAFHACQSCPHVSRSRDALRKHVSYRHPDQYLTRKRKKCD